jgi:hypothetical protein
MEEAGYMKDADLLPAYLYKRLPGDDIMIYSESSNLSASLKMIGNMYSKMDGFNEVFSQFKGVVQMVGLNYEDEILPMVEKGYAMAFYGGNIVPKFGLFFDASNKPDAAKKILALMDNGIKMLVNQAEAQYPGVINLSDTGENQHSIRLNMQSLPAEMLSGVPETVKSLNVEFHYGLKDDILYLALYPNFTKGGFGTLADLEEFKRVYSFIPGYDKGITYLDGENIISYVDSLVQFGMEAQQIKSVYPEEYVVFRENFRHLKSLILSAKSFEKGMAEGEGFLRIE